MDVGAPCMSHERLLVKVVVRWQWLALFGLVALGLLLRLYGLNWDQGNNFHPDERQILFRVIALRWPTSWAEFFDPTRSGLNPHFFAYGSFPLYFLGLVRAIFFHNLNDAEILVPLTLAGRTISAIFDSGTILLTGWLGLRLMSYDESSNRAHGWMVALLAAALLVFTPLHLQLSHFYAVDTMMVFFVVLTLLAAVALVNTTTPVRWIIVAGIAYGLAMATKVSASPLIVPLLVAVVLRWYRERRVLNALLTILPIVSIALVLFLLTQPYVLLDRANFIQQITEQSEMAQGKLDFPYTRQFAGTIPVLYQVQNIVLWGMGLMLGCCAFIALGWLLWRIGYLWRTERRSIGPWLIILAWICVYGASTGSFYVKFMRYMLPLYPALIVIGAAGLLALARWSKLLVQDRSVSLRRVQRGFSVLLLFLVLGGTMFQGLALLNVYSMPNTRVVLSKWVYQHIQPGSTLTYEQWDDPMPISIDNHQPFIYPQATYDRDGNQQQGLDLYGDDTIRKAHELANLLPTINDIIMASDRLDKSIPRLPDRYPLTIRYYQLLFNGELGFRLVAQFENHPHLFGITLDDSNADESYSVFDHPTGRIFERMNPYPYTPEQLFQKLTEGLNLPE